MRKNIKPKNPHLQFKFYWSDAAIFRQRTWNKEKSTDFLNEILTHWMDKEEIYGALKNLVPSGLRYNEAETYLHNVITNLEYTFTVKHCGNYFVHYFFGESNGHRIFVSREVNPLDTQYIYLNYYDRPHSGEGFRAFLNDKALELNQMVNALNAYNDENKPSMSLAKFLNDPISLDYLNMQQLIDY